MGASTYVVPDPAGDRGPFSTDEIRAFVAAGTLRPTTRIRHAGRTVTVQQVVDGHAAFAAVAAGTEEIEPEPLPPIAPVARGRARPVTTTRSRTGVERRTTRTVARGDSSGSRGTGRTPRRAAGGNARLLIALGVAAAVALGALVAFAAR